MNHYRSPLGVGGMAMLAVLLGDGLAACGGREQDGTLTGNPPKSSAARQSGVGDPGSGAAAPGRPRSPTIPATGGTGPIAATSVGSGGDVGGATTSSTNATTAPEPPRVMACPGIPVATGSSTELYTACNGVSLDAEPVPFDMVLLMDRANGYAYSSESDASELPGPGQTSRWRVLTSAIEALATSPEASMLGVSLTFYGKTGTNVDAGNCSASDYEQPDVPMDLLKYNGLQLVEAMRAIEPAGLSPTVPALVGAYQYAMVEQQKDRTREKVVVLFTDGFPTECSARFPSDVVSLIADAAAAPVPIHTFVVGVGTTQLLDAARYNLAHYAQAGDTQRPPYILDLSRDTQGFPQRLIATLLDISNRSLSCEYALYSPSPDWVIDPDRVRLVYQPIGGELQELPRLADASGCTQSPNGGYYFDDPANPSRIIACPCSCANLGSGKLSIIFGCDHGLTIE